MSSRTSRGPGSSERAGLIQSYASDPKYKKYAQQVEKCLSSFENVQEWADCTAFLKQLLKTFQAYIQFKEIPRKLIVAKRLSQCLNPALPTGVHQRALEVYVHILNVLGSEGLNADLAIWSSGLFPFFEYAATSVKPTLLSIYDTHYLPLQDGLRPIMKSFILALLPGLEEETGEFFDQVLSLLDKLSGTVSPSFFFQNIWLVMLTTAPARGTALNFLSRRLPKLKPEEDFSHVVGSDIGLMIRAFSACLEDDNLLVRRSALDLLLQSLRIDSVHVIKAQAEDRAILMRAASSVVLRRDLSLNRRLYAWLLGPDEDSRKQVAHFQSHGLELLRSTLKEDMFDPSVDYSESRPFKIFISLLDKWEIGAALSDALVYDAFVSIRRSSESVGSGEDIAMTATTLYEAIEPQALWKHILSGVFAEITGSSAGTEAIKLAEFILRTFRHDDEVRTVHLPIVMAAISEVIARAICSDATTVKATVLEQAFRLLKEIVPVVPPDALLTRSNAVPDAAELCPEAFARTFFGIKSEPSSSLPNRHLANIPAVTVFQDLTTASLALSKSSLMQDAFTQSLALLNSFSERLAECKMPPMEVDWDVKEWSNGVFEYLDQSFVTFTTVDGIITVCSTLQRTNVVKPNVLIDERAVILKMVNALFRYLRPNFPLYHVRAVHLLWSLEGSTSKSHVESIVAQSLTSPESRNVSHTHEAFGVFWRLSEDNLLPGFHFKAPMFIVLDTLRKDDPGLRRIGETWMRCSLKSYLRVLDPILFDLLDPEIRRLPHTTQVNGRELPGFLYERPMNQHYIQHLLELLLAIVRFGGQGCTKTLRSTRIQKSPYPPLVERAELLIASGESLTYLEVVVELLLRLLASEPKPSAGRDMQPSNIGLQSVAVDVLQALVARGEMDELTVQTIEASVIGKLYFAVHMNRLDLQNKLLHLLHSVISASTAIADARKQEVLQTSTRDGPGPEPPMTHAAHAVNPLLLQALIDAITIDANRPMRQHWLDFILMTLPQFQQTLQSIVGPLNDCVCRQLRIALEQLQRAAHTAGGDGDVNGAISDAEFVMMLNALERLVLLNLSHPLSIASSEEDTLSPEKSASEHGGLFGIMSNVFSSDNAPATAPEQLSARSPGYNMMNESIRVLYSIWTKLLWNQRTSPLPQDESLALIYGRTRSRALRVLENLFRAHSAEVVECVIECWSQTPPDDLSNEPTAFELIDILTSSAQAVVHMVCESIGYRIATSTEKSRRQIINPQLPEGTLFAFLEEYLARLEGPLALQVWRRFLQMAKDVVGNTREYKQQTFPTLRCMTVLADKVTQTTAVEDRKLRKDLQDTYGKLLDSCVNLVGRDQGTWIRRTTKEALAVNGRDSPAPGSGRGTPIARIASEPPSNEKASSQDGGTPAMAAPSDSIVQIIRFVASDVLSNLRRFLVENDKVTAACNNITYYIVSPAMKGRTRPLDLDPSIIAILREMTRIQPALKAWRAPVMEVLVDSRVFNSTPNAGEDWKPIVKALMDMDKSAFQELLGKISTTPSANIFANREYEMLVQSLNLRRLSYTILSGDKNNFLTQLPSVQEKLVEILRNVTSPVVLSEVYLCMRVLLCRLSPHNMTSFWPVILTELYRLFDQVKASTPADGSEELPLVLAACKFLDLLLVLQTQEFQIHQWIFVTDTVDAVYRPEEWSPEALMDQLADVAANLPLSDSRMSDRQPAASPGPTPATSLRSARRPMLSGQRTIDSIRDLVPFFSHVSIVSYESVYASAGVVDWEAVERGILEDMFDGR